jgi:hypothetical protein
MRPTLELPRPLGAATGGCNGLLEMAAAASRITAPSQEHRAAATERGRRLQTDRGSRTLPPSLRRPAEANPRAASDHRRTGTRITSSARIGGPPQEHQDAATERTRRLQPTTAAEPRHRRSAARQKRCGERRSTRAATPCLHPFSNQS